LVMYLSRCSLTFLLQSKALLGFVASMLIILLFLTLASSL
jgi:hypothetical protein